MAHQTVTSSWAIADRLSETEEKFWNDFIQRHGSVFHLTPYAKACASIGYKARFASFGEEARTIAFTKKVGPSTLGLNWVVFFAEPAFADTCPLQDRPKITHELLAAFSAKHPAYISTIGSMARFMSGESLPSGVKQTPFGTYEIDLTPTEDILWATVHSKHRNAIRAAEKLGVSVSEESDWETFYQLLGDTLKRAGEAYPPSAYLLPASEGLKRACACTLWVAKHEGRWQAAALILYTAKRAYYWFGATESKAVTGSGNLLHWTLMKALKSQGIKTYDLGGARPGLNPESKLYGIQRFKERFGGIYRDYPQWRLDCSPVRSAILRSLVTVKRITLG